jgi:protein-disulfide isomerase
LQGILDENPEAVEVRFRNWPLPYHPLAANLAVQARCAGRQDRFWAYHDLLFAVQDSVARFHADSLARLARIPDLSKWQACLSDSAILREIATETALAKSISAQGTPTVVVNGYRYLGYPDLEELHRLVARGQR